MKQLNCDIHCSISPFLPEEDYISRWYPQVETEVKVPDCEAELAVVDWVRVPVTVAVVPEALLLKVNDAEPLPPTTCSSSPSFNNSIRISI
jgi:hypothetical protein